MIGVLYYYYCNNISPYDRRRVVTHAIPEWATYLFLELLFSMFRVFLMLIHHFNSKLPSSAHKSSALSM